MTTKQPLVERLHDDLHKIPGIPPHDQAAALNSNSHATHAHSVRHAKPHPSSNARAARNSAAHHNDPKVLVGWQQFIGRLFSRAKD